MLAQSFLPLFVVARPVFLRFVRLLLPADVVVSLETQVDQVLAHGATHALC